MSAELRPYVDRPPEFEVRDGVVCCDFGDFRIHMPLRVFRISHMRAAKAIRDHDGRNAKVVSIGN